MSFDGITRTALERATAGVEGARHIGSQLTGYAGTNVQTLLEAITGRVLPSGGTTGQVLTKSSNTDYAVSFTTPGGAADASETVKGIAELATQGETDTGTDDARIVTPLKLAVTRAATDYKQSVRAATTANITLSGTQTVDGVALVAGNRCGVKNQSTGSQNGIYDVASGAWTRSSDADTSAKVTPQLFVRVEEGTANGGKAFVLTNTGTITLGTTALTFAENTPTPAAHGPSHNIGGSDSIQRFIEKDFIFQGALPTANGTTTGTLRVPIIVDSTIVGITVTIDALPVGAGSSQTLDLLRSGTTVYTTSGNRPSFVPGGSQFITATLPDVTALTGGTHYLKANLVTAGSPSSGGTSIVMTVRYRQ